MLLLAALSVRSLDIYNISYEAPRIGEPLNITVSKDHNISLTLQIRDDITTGYTGIDEVQGTFSIPASVLSREGTYDFYFNYTSRYPALASFKMPIFNSSHFIDLATRLLENSSDDTSGCNPSQGQYTCSISSFQTAQILGFASLYHRTGNETYLNISHSLLTSKYVEDIWDSANHCDAFRDDYDCAGINRGSLGSYSGAERQGKNIYRLAKSYRLTGNSSFLGYAISYADGSASECDVWSGDYSCGNDTDQSWMALAYLELYELTNNETYLTIHQNLFSSAVLTDHLSPLLAYRRYQLLNSSYSDLTTAKQNTADTCTGSCSLKDKLMQSMSFARLHESSMTYDSRRDYESKLYSSSGDCDPLEGNFVCSTSEEQAAYADVLLGAPIENATAHIFDIYFDRSAAVQQNISVHVKGKGDIENPMLYFRGIDSSVWDSVNLSDLTASINASYVAEANVYEFYVNHSDGRFPAGNGTIKKVFNQKIEQVNKTIHEFLGQDTQYFCDVHGTKSKYEDLACRMEHMQARMMHAFADSHVEAENQSDLDIAESLSIAQIDDTNSTLLPSGLYQTCDHTYDDFVCEDINPNYAANPLKKNATYKQAALIEAYARLYRYNDSVRRLLYSYAYNDTSACSVWSGDFDCGDDQAQALLMAAYIEAYRATGEEDLLDVAKALADDDLTRNSSLQLIRAYALLYEVSGNSTYINRSREVIDDHESACESLGCDVESYSAIISGTFEAFQQTGDPYYQDLAFTKTTYDPDPSTMCNPNAEGISARTCRYPHQKGDMVRALLYEYETFYAIDKNYSVNLTLPATTSFNHEFNLTCQVTNVGEFANTQVEIVLFTNSMDILNVTAPTTPASTITGNRVKFSTVSANETVSINYTVNATIGGLQQITCSAYSYSNSSEIAVEDLGDIVDLQYDSLVGNYVSTNRTLIYNISNIYDFDIYNITIEVISDNVSIVNITSDESAFEEVSSSVFSFDYLTSRNQTFNITYNAGAEGLFNITLNITGDYNVSSSYVQELMTYADPFSGSVTAASVPIYKRHNISYAAANLKNMTFYDVALSLRGNMTIEGTNISSSANYSVVNSTHLMVNFSEFSSINISWLGYHNRSGTDTLQLSLDSAGFHLDEEYAASITLDDDHFNFSESSPSSPRLNTIYPIYLNISNLADFNVSDFNVTIENSSDFIVSTAASSAENSSNITQTNSSIYLDVLAYNDTLQIYWNISLSSQDTAYIYLSMDNLAGEQVNYTITLDPYVAPPDNSPSGGSSSSSTGGGGGGGGFWNRSEEITLYHTYDLEYITGYVNRTSDERGLNTSHIWSVANLSYYIINKSLDVRSIIKDRERDILVINKENTTLNFTLMLWNKEQDKNLTSGSMGRLGGYLYSYILLGPLSNISVDIQYSSDIDSRLVRDPYIVFNQSVDEPEKNFAEEEIVEPLVEEKRNESGNVTVVKKPSALQIFKEQAQTFAHGIFERIVDLSKSIREGRFWLYGLIIVFVLILLGLVMNRYLKTEQLHQFLSLIEVFYHYDKEDWSSIRGPLDKLLHYVRRKVRYPLDPGFRMTVQGMVELYSLKHQINTTKVHIHDLRKRDARSETIRNQEEKLQRLEEEEKDLLEKYKEPINAYRKEMVKQPRESKKEVPMNEKAIYAEILAYYYYEKNDKKDELVGQRRKIEDIGKRLGELDKPLKRQDLLIAHINRILTDHKEK